MNHILEQDNLRCLPASKILQEIIASKVLYNVFNQISDPDFINQSIVNALSGVGREASQTVDKACYSLEIKLLQVESFFLNVEG
jgi:hypothetical protein